MAFENENKYSYNGLQELSSSDWEIRDGEPDITGWSVFNSLGDKIGEVDDLLFDAQARKVRYIVLELQANGMDVLDDRMVLIPIGVAELHSQDDHVLLPIATAQRLTELPVYRTGSLTPETEMTIRNVFEGNTGSTAPYEHPQFYQHEHFNEDKFYGRGTIIETNDIADESPESQAARAERVSRIVAKINNKTND